MKKLLALAIAILLAMSVNAQKGSRYLGLSSISFWGNNNIGTGFSYTKKGETSTISYGISPEYGYFASDKFVLGLILGFSGSKTEGQYQYYCYGCESSVVEEKFTFRFNPYARCFLIQNGNFGLYLQSGFNLEWEGNSNKLGLFILPGVSYALSSSFAATASFGNLGFQVISEPSYDVAYAVGLNLNMSTLNLGLSYTF